MKNQQETIIVEKAVFEELINTVNSNKKRIDELERSLNELDALFVTFVENGRL